MVDLKITIHPLFFVFGLYFAFIGKVFSFLIYTLVAVMHEMGHYFASIKLGYKLNRITLMPYGAIITGDITGLLYKDECKISLAGPLLNLITALFFVALWWFIPEVYAYTDIIVSASLSLAVINLLPCYPLDGGRFLLATLSLYLNRKTAKKIVSLLGVLLALVLIALFIFSLFNTPNVTLIFFALFMLIGTFSTSEKNSYVKAYSNVSFSKDNKPKLIKRIAVPSNLLIKDLYSIIDSNFYYEVKVIDDNNNNFILLEGDDLQALLTENSIYSTIKDGIKKSPTN